MTECPDFLGASCTGGIWYGDGVLVLKQMKAGGGGGGGGRAGGGGGGTRQQTTSDVQPVKNQGPLHHDEPLYQLRRT